MFFSHRGYLFLLDPISIKKNAKVINYKLYFSLKITNLIDHGLLYIWTELLSIFLADLPTWGVSVGTKLRPGSGFFGPWHFLTLKISHQDLSNEGSNFILSPLEVGHWVVQTQPFLTNYLKLQILASYNNLRIGYDSEFGKFGPRPLVM